MNCTCTKEIVVEDCTEDEAENDPLAFAVEETEVECDIVRVVKVVANR